MRAGRAPAFWWRKAGWEARALVPAAALYGLVSGRRLARGARAEAALPVLCVGNFTVGGGGKTPTVLALGRAAREMGLRPGFLTRGHGGRAREPLLVDPARHGASLVGDEPMLLAAEAPTAVAIDRRQGVALLAQAGCDLVLMDDGFQSARLRPDLALLVVDAHRAFGNGRVLPAGPLRAPLALQLARANALLIVGTGPGEPLIDAAASAAAKPVYRAGLEALNGADWAGRPCLAFAGIADPAKFHRSLRAVGADIRETRDFPDHHPLSDAEARALLARADETGLELATTAKDRVRLEDGGPIARQLAGRALVLDIALRFEDDDTARHLLQQARTRSGAAGAARPTSAPAQRRVDLQLALQRGVGVDIGLLPRDAPVFQEVERDLVAGDGTAHVGARPKHPRNRRRDSEAWPRRRCPCGSSSFGPVAARPVRRRLCS